MANEHSPLLFSKFDKPNSPQLVVFSDEGKAIANLDAAYFTEAQLASRTPSSPLTEGKENNIQQLDSTLFAELTQQFKKLDEAHQEEAKAKGTGTFRNNNEISSLPPRKF